MVRRVFFSGIQMPGTLKRFPESLDDLPTHKGSKPNLAKAPSKTRISAIERTRLPLELYHLRRYHNPGMWGDW